jgi:hypothetical protein
MNKPESKIVFWAAIPVVLVFCGGWAALFNWLFDNATLGAVFGATHIILLGISATTDMLAEEIRKIKKKKHKGES